jgi:hypothetical protein
MLLSCLCLGVAGGFNGTRADAKADQAETRAFLKQLTEQYTTDAAGAAQAAVRFEQQHASMNPVLLKDVDTVLAGIYFKYLKDPVRALAVLDAGLARSTKPESYFPLVITKCKILEQAKRPAEGIAFFKQNMPGFMKAQSYYFLEALPFYLSAVKAGDKTEDATAILFEALKTHPFLIDSLAGDSLTQILLRQSGHEEEALGYAKLYWQICDYNERNISAATRTLQKAWLAKDVNAARGIAFLKAQQDAASPNPLADVKAAALDAAAIEDALQFYSQYSSIEARHNRITLLLLQGKNSDAMLVARRQLLDDPANGDKAALEIARIFKATDLNLVRANAFLQYFKTGEGANPLDAFFKEHPAGAEAPAPVH